MRGSDEGFRLLESHKQLHLHLEENAASITGRMEVDCGDTPVAGRKQYDIFGSLPIELVLNVVESLDITDIVRSRSVCPIDCSFGGIVVV